MRVKPDLFSNLRNRSFLIKNEKETVKYFSLKKMLSKQVIDNDDIAA
jgi:hypothetical protein